VLILCLKCFEGVPLSYGDVDRYVGSILNVGWETKSPCRELVEQTGLVVCKTRGVLKDSMDTEYIVARLMKARIVKPARTDVTWERLYKRARC
jgi:hypothetical protein